MKKLIAVLILAWASAGLAWGPPYIDTYWQGTTGDWSDPANWSNGVPDTFDHDAYVNNGGTVRITQPGAACNWLHLGLNEGDVLFLPNGDAIQYGGHGYFQLTRTTLATGRSEELIDGMLRTPRVNAARTMLVAGRRSPLEDGTPAQTADVLVVQLEDGVVHTVATAVQLVDITIADEHVAYTVWNDDVWSVWLSSLQ